MYFLRGSFKEKCIFLFRSATFAFPFFSENVSHLWCACIWKMLPQAAFVSGLPSVTVWDFPEDPRSLSPLLNKPHDIYNRVDVLKKN